MPMQETRQESKTVPLRQPAAPADTPRSHSLALKDRSRLALTRTPPCWKRRWAT